MQTKPERVSLVAAATMPAADAYRVKTVAPTRIFKGWLHSVGPNRYGRARLTTEEVLQVNLATVRESYNHRLWPREVIQKFVAAEVIPGRR